MDHIRLSAKQLYKHYRGCAVVHNVSFELNSGETVVLMGPNGAGKTTSFYMIIGLVLADSGSIYLGDQNISHMSIDKRSHLGLGYLPQESSVFAKLTVAENIMMILETRKDLNRQQAGDKLEYLMDTFNISHLSNQLAISLSGGERRRLEIARSLTTDPKFLLLDEPFSGVDPISVDEIQQLIKSLNQQGIGILMTDHNVRETLKTCDRAYIINAGKLIKSGTAEDILADNVVRQVYLGDKFSL